METRARDKHKTMMYAIPGQIYLDKTEEEARSQVKNLVGENENLYHNILARHFVGSPETIRKRVEDLSELGFDYIIFQPTPALKTLTKMHELL
jgi:alkanesulfonate monooxygenase SsuD/methylene tetrahydromethanopterin reductase-like flavin-dependent oxidoreductase (luciferase family)